MITTICSLQSSGGLANKKFSLFRYSREHHFVNPIFRLLNTRTRRGIGEDDRRTERRDQQEIIEGADHHVVFEGPDVKILEHWDHPCEKRAERRIGKDLNDEVDIKGIEDQRAVLVHGEVRVKCGPAEINGKEVGTMGGSSGDGSELGGRTTGYSANRFDESISAPVLEAWRVKPVGCSIAR